MSFISGLFGGNGSSFQAQGANLVNPTSGQAQGAIDQSGNAINQQQALAAALASQNGIQNQSNVYNQLGQVASGQGPNPAAAMLSQATASNIAQQTAAQAGQRGASQNAGLIARDAAQQGGALQQNAAGQAATMQANQSLGALGQQAAIAGQQVGNQIGAQGALTGASQAQAGQLIGANVAQNQGNIQNAQQQNASNAAIATENAKGQQNILGNAAGAVGAAFGLAHGGMVPHYDTGGYTNFGMNPYAPTPMQPYQVQQQVPQQQQQPGLGGGQSSYAASWQNGTLGSSLGKGIHNWVKNMFTPSGPTGSNVSDYTSLPDAQPAQAEPAQAEPMPEAQDEETYAKGGRVPSMVSPGEKILTPTAVKKVEQGKKSAISAGETVHGKAKVAGDSLRNDTVPKNLAAGSIVLPRSVTQSTNPGVAAQRFVDALLTKQKGKRAA